MHHEHNVLLQAPPRGFGGNPPSQRVGSHTWVGIEAIRGLRRAGAACGLGDRGGWVFDRIHEDHSKSLIEAFIGQVGRSRDLTGPNSMEKVMGFRPL